MSTQSPLQLPGQTGFYRGKVRDVYYIGDETLVAVASDRISAFDHILPRPIPHKGQVLNQLAAHFLKSTAHLVPNWLRSMPDPNASLGQRCKPVPIEMVVRGYCTGHAWRTYASGERLLCGVTMPEGMKEHDRFPEPIITPTTKAYEGHDEDTSEEEILRKGEVPAEVWNTMKKYALALFAEGTRMAAERGLILVDTKYEFGIAPDGSVMLIDEVHTPDSSRYFFKEGYQERQDRGEAQRQLSKEFVREWLISKGFMGKEGQTMPDMPDEFVEQVSKRYIELYELVTGLAFVPADVTDVNQRLQQNLDAALSVK